MDRFTWAIVAGVLALVAAGVAVAALRSPEPPPDLSTPSGVVLAYERALQRGDLDQAWSLLATSTRERVGYDRFVRRATPMVDARSATQTRLVVEKETIAGDTATVELVRTYPPPGPFAFGSAPATRHTVRVVREGGAWRIAVPADPFLVAEPEEREP